MSENGTALVSQSEADTFLNCQQKHYYAFGEPNIEGSRGIAAKEHSDSLTRGIIGHEGMASYYTARMNGESHDVGTRQALMTVLGYETTLTDIKAEVVALLRNYFEYYEEDFDKYQPIAIEREFRYKIPGTGLIFPFKPDAIMRNRATGEVSIWDHKFLYNYYQERIFPLMPQMKKYGYALREMGFKVDSYLYNQISTRKNTKEPFRRSPVTLHERPAELFMNEQVSTMKKIIWLKSLPDGLWQESIERNAGHFTCSKCPFAELCASDVEGRTGRKILISSDFAPNKYRYEKEED